MVGLPSSLPAAPVPAAVASRARRVAERLARSLRQGGLTLVYQPEVQLQPRRVLSFETLSRWHDDELGLVTPSEFIAVAEDNGLVPAIGRHVLQQVLADLPALQARWPGVRVAVNVSGVELADPAFADQVSRTLTKADQARLLEFEVTESVFHHDLPTVLHNLQALRALGITVAIDDFGTGQSSLARLHQLPFDKIKLDRAFVQALDKPMVQAIVQGVAQLAQQFGLQLVVEGVETPAQLQTLQTLGCPVVQGYLLGAPQPLQTLLTQTLP